MVIMSFCDNDQPDGQQSPLQQLGSHLYMIVRRALLLGRHDNRICCPLVNYVLFAFLNKHQISQLAPSDESNIKI
eukprot:4204144-Ditylum_brightwellii.AAC.1